VRLVLGGRWWLAADAADQTLQKVSFRHDAAGEGAPDHGEGRWDVDHSIVSGKRRCRPSRLLHATGDGGVSLVGLRTGEEVVAATDMDRGRAFGVPLYRAPALTNMKSSCV
jgi:hypothetical protein